MKKVFFLLLAVLSVACLFGQDTNTVTLTLPKTLDFKTPAAFSQTAGLIISAVLTVVSGFWAKGNEVLKKYLPTTERRVAFVGLLVSVGVGLAFGFSPNVLTTLWTALIGVLTAMGGFGAVKASAK